MSELEDVVAARLKRKVREGLSFEDVALALSALSQPRQARLVSALARRQPSRIGAIVMSAVDNYIVAVAENEAAAVLADESLSKSELNQIFGGRGK